MHFVTGFRLVGGNDTSLRDNQEISFPFSSACNMGLLNLHCNTWVDEFMSRGIKLEQNTVPFLREWVIHPILSRT
jgi:hypothetical protein